MPRQDFLHSGYPAAQQRRFTEKLMRLLGLPPERCRVTEIAHPLTMFTGPDSVRISTHYYEDDVSRSMYSVLHEGGHALYRLGLPGAWK